jgi:hypothetical protein
MKTEIWKDVNGYEGKYQISNWGRVKSLNYRKKGVEAILKTSTDNKGYHVIKLCKNGAYKTYRVHQLVAMVFLDHQPDGHNLVINHIDNDPSNNYVDNLEIVTVRYNNSCHKNDPGVSLSKQYKCYEAYIRIKQVKIHLGLYNDKQDGIDMYQKALRNRDMFNGDVNAFREYLKTV